MRRLLFALAVVIAACGGATTETADTGGDQPDTDTATVTTTAPAPTVTTAPAPTTTTTEAGFIASLSPEEAARLRLLCEAAADGVLGGPVEMILAGEIPLPPEIYAAFEEALADRGLDGAAAAIDAGCANLEFPEVETSAEPEPETPGGLLVMEFSDVVLEYEIDECPLETLASGGSWSSGNRPIATNTVDGSDWQIDVYVDHGSETYSAGAIGPDGSPNFSAFTGAGQVAAVYETEVSDSAAVYSSTFRDNIYQGEPDTAFTMTITCDS